jgi:hypothetical protein
MLRLYSKSGSVVAPIRRRWRVADLTEETTMTDPENPLARWSRRKSDARAGEGDGGAASHDNDASVFRPGGTLPSARPPSFDLTSLPTIASISAETDLRAFLGRGVPPELTVAALRRAWSADPTIRDFIGLSENSWDFNAPGGIPGFGALEPGEIQRLLARLIGGDEVNEGAPASAAPLPSDGAMAQETECAASLELPQDVPSDDMDTHSAQNTPEDPGPARIASADSVDAATSKARPAVDRDVQTPSQRPRHGGALPRFDAI